MKTTDFWAGDGGAEYTERNRVDWRKRITFWRDTIPQDVETVFEVGCNAGWNLRAIRACRNVKTQGIELNEAAASEAQARGLAVQQQNILTMQAFPLADLTFTAGVLIHMAPEQIDDAMEQITALARKYVLCIEYEDEQETEVQYRGEAGLLWRRPYAKLYQALGLRLVKQVDAGPGFDRCMASLLEKR